MSMRCGGVWVSATMTMLMAIHAGADGQAKGDSAKLTYEEAATIRKAVYTKGQITTHEISKTTGVAYTALVIPENFETIYKAKRLATLRLLLEVVKGGRPDDAISAYAFAVGMEDGLLAGAICARETPDDFDQETPGLKTTSRDHHVRQIEKMIAKAGAKKQ